VEWTVRELAERAGISGRTLRHYHRIGLLEPDRVGSNGYRYYGPTSVARLQRILLLRGTGMPLTEIAIALAESSTGDSEMHALESHLDQLRGERTAIDQRIAAVEHTLSMRRAGREPRMDVMLDGFNDRYRDEVVSRWGQEAFDASHTWWHAKSLAQQRQWQTRAEQLLARWAELDRHGATPDSDAAQQHAIVHVDWFAEIPGTPTHAGDSDRSADMIRGMAAMYESDPDFHDAFGSLTAARLAAEALRIRADQGLGATPRSR
jgi:MerR family transcriptional regulator, thiopeptide resistance regulator